MSSSIAPSQVQQLALSSPAFETLFGGAKGGGKTHLLALWFAQLFIASREEFQRTRILQSRCRAVVFRRQRGDLTDFQIKASEIFSEIFSPDGFQYDKQNHCFNFSFGARLELEHLKDPDTYRSFHGQEFIRIGFDQVEEVTHEEYSFIVANVRTNEGIYRRYLGVMSTANPGGFAWPFKRFIEPHPAGGRLIRESVQVKNKGEWETKTVTRVFVPSKISDNPHVDPVEYEARLRVQLGPERAQQLIDGDWSVVDGAFFAWAMDERKLSVEPFRAPDTWDIRAGVDWGYTAPCAWVFGALDSDGTVWIMHEEYLTQPGKTGAFVAEIVASRLSEQDWHEGKVRPDDFHVLIDKQAFDGGGAAGASAGAALAEVFRVSKSTGGKNRRSGNEQIFSRLRSGKIRIVRKNCPNLWRQLMSVKRDEFDQDDYDHNGDVHAIDALRFLLMSWPIGDSIRARTEEEIHRDALSVYHARAVEAERTGKQQEGATNGYN